MAGELLGAGLAAYGVLKDKDAALFVEYDGYWRHGEKAGMDRDRLKNASLLAYAPPGSKVIRICHTVTESVDDRTLFICANNWRQGDQRALANSLKCVLAEAVSWMKDSLQKDVLTRLHLGISKEVIKISIGAQRVVAAARVAGGQNTAEEMENFLVCEGFAREDIARMLKGPLSRGYSIEAQLQPKLQWLLKLGLSKAQVAKAVATFPKILSCSIEQNLKPTVQWLLDFGLSKAQVAKAVATSPSILGFSIEQNLKPTVQWFLELGLSKAQVAKTMANCPQSLCCSIEQNLKPTVQWLLDMGLSKAQVAKAVAASPSILCCSIEENLKPTVQWLLDLSVSKVQVAKVVAAFPSILGCSIEQNLKPKVQWLLDLGLTKAQVAKALANKPQILGYSIEHNLKPTVRWLLDLGLSQAQVAKIVAACPPILGLSIEQNLELKIQWLLDLGLSKTQVSRLVVCHPPILGYSVGTNMMPKYELLMGAFGIHSAAQLVARCPQILSYSYKRLAERLSLLRERDEAQRLASAMRLTEAAFQKRFLW